MSWPIFVGGVRREVRCADSRSLRRPEGRRRGTMRSLLDDREARGDAAWLSRQKDDDRCGRGRWHLRTE